ncbi:putative conserved membrane protein [Rhodovastum atsumiense]|uniref:DUF58 domain-containing protein n=1 Tax=Rhodovastum atsumiense TaxID=504468 RepID=A0A5M6IYN5_9PROT|nr:DUF58 domain-containing protein [Rhodovastum atsumiense]KAA5613049.1 DUF58 domain-containing protein [Rhodovastum atsumiense]CAH2600091.1 putative conserved membrane protein [Rhodovastum atsumiense]
MSEASGAGSPAGSARRAEALGARLPPLLVAAERVAATVAQGVHGRRRVGQGDSFWQYRPFLAGDPASRIDWRQSARSDGAAHTRYFVRETEWEAAQTVVLWCDGSATMRWHSRQASTSKHERAGLLTLALAALLLRGGERVRLLAPDARTASGRVGLERLAAELERLPDGEGLPPEARLPRHARVVLIGDLLRPLAEIQAAVGRLAAVPVSGHVLQVLDPAEALLPYAGRVRFQGMQPAQETLIPRVEGVRDAYIRRLAEQQEGLAAICAAAGFGFSVHRTDHPPESALLALYTALTPQTGTRAAGGR